GGCQPEGAEPLTSKIHQPAGWATRVAPSEIPLLLLLLHRARLVRIDQAAFAFGSAGGLHFHDDGGKIGGAGADGAGQRIAAEGAEAHRLLMWLFTGGKAE